MSGIYIPGMEMPGKCISCKLMSRCGENDLDYVCMPARIYVEDLTNAYKPRPDYCPLIELPPHGRLIDADAMIEKDNKDFSAAMETAVGLTAKQMIFKVHVQLQKEIEIQHTIIPAEEVIH